MFFSSSSLSVTDNQIRSDVVGTELVDKSTAAICLANDTLAVVLSY